MRDPSMHIIYLNDEPNHSPYWDRGFLYGESVYDVIAFYQKKTYSLAEHFERFRRDLLLMKMQFPMDFETFTKHIQRVIDATPYPDGAVYIQVTSGCYPIRTAMPPTQETPTVIFMAFEHQRPKMPELISGNKLVLYPEIRGAFCHVKSTNRLANRLALLHAKDQGATEALWFDPTHQHLHECTHSNIFFIQDNQLITPDLSPFVFQGLARERVMRLADMLGIPTVSRTVLRSELEFFHGAFISGSTKQLIPIRQIDNYYYPVHPLWNTLFIEYNKHINESLHIPAREDA